MFKKLYSIKEKIVNTAVSHPKAITIGTSLAVGAGIVVAANFANIGVQMVHADMGGMGCATSFNPHLHSRSNRIKCDNRSSRRYYMRGT